MTDGTRPGKTGWSTGIFTDHKANRLQQSVCLHQRRPESKSSGLEARHVWLGYVQKCQTFSMMRSCRVWNPYSQFLTWGDVDNERAHHWGTTPPAIGNSGRRCRSEPGGSQGASSSPPGQSKACLDMTTQKPFEATFEPRGHRTLDDASRPVTGSTCILFAGYFQAGAWQL